MRILAALLLPTLLAGCTATPPTQPGATPVEVVEIQAMTEDTYVDIVVEVLCLGAHMDVTDIAALDTATEEIFRTHGANMETFTTLQATLEADPSAASRLQPLVLGGMSTQCPTALDSAGITFPAVDTIDAAEEDA